MEVVMETRILSLEESNRMLPLLRQIVQDIMEHWSFIIGKRAELEALESAKEETKSSSHQAKLHEVKQDLNAMIDKINQYIKEVEGLGCFVEEFKRGIVNFPSLFHGRKVFLCWQPVEDAIAHWHELDETFNDRVKIKDESDFLCEKTAVSGHGSRGAPARWDERV
jgi:hypothetical protein